MSKLNDNSQDEVRPETSALDDIPFAIEVNEDEEAAVVVGSDDDESVAASDVANTTAGAVADDGEGAIQGEDMEDEAAAEEGQEGSTQKKRSSRSKNARSKVSFEPPLSLREILFGDFLLGTFLRRQVWFILFLVALGIFYISNRYAAQQEIIEEETLRKELVEKKNYALTQYAELTMASRQSGLEERLRSFGDSLLTTSNEPPFVIQTEE